MLYSLIRKDVLSHILSLRFGVSFILFLVLVFSSIYITVNDYKQGVREYGKRERAHKDSFTQIKKTPEDWERFYNLFYNQGLDIAVPVSPYSWFGLGLQPSCPESINVKADLNVRNIEKGEKKNPLTALFNTPDFFYVVNIMLSLLAILFMFDSICGEKESGTLRLMLSNAVPRHLILLSKWLGGYITLMLPFFISVAAGLTYAFYAGVFDLDSETVVRVFLVLAVACLYISVFFTLSLFVSTATHRSATSLLACLLIWVSFILVIPNLAPVTARILEPTPALQKIESEKRAIDEEVYLKKQRLTQLTGELSYGKKIEIEKEKLEKEGERQKKRWDNFYKDSLSRQNELASVLGRISPSALWQYAATELTCTGPASYEHLEKAKKKTARQFMDYHDDFRASWKKTGYQKQPELVYSDMPKLVITHSDLSNSFNHAMNDILILVIFNVVFFMLSFVFFLRYDVR